MTCQKILLIPAWIAESVKYRKIALADLADLTAIKDKFSIQDLAELVILDRYHEELLGLCIDREYFGCLEWSWRTSSVDENIKRFIDDKILPLVESQKDLLLKSVAAKLAANPINICEGKFIPGSHIVDQQKSDCAVTTIEAKPGVSLIVINQGFFNPAERNPKVINELIEKVLKIFYVYQPHHKVATTNVADKYLKSLLYGIR